MSMISILMKRALKKMNRQFNRPFRPHEINNLRVRYVNKVFRTLVVDKALISKDKEINFVKLFEDYMFLPLSRLKGLYEEGEKDIIRFVFTRIIELNEIEEVKDFRKKRIQKVKNQKALEEYYEKNLWHLTPSIKRSLLLEEFIEETERVKEVYQQISLNEYNSYRRYQMKELIGTIEDCLKTMEKKVFELNAERKNSELMSIWKRSKETVGECLKRLKGAKIEQEIMNFEEVFIYSDLED